VNVAKTKRILRAQRNQKIRSSSDAHHENNEKQDDHLGAFRVVKKETLGRELMEIMTQITSFRKRFECEFGVRLDSSVPRRSLKKGSRGRLPLSLEQQEASKIHFAQHGTAVAPDLAQKLILIRNVGH